MPASLDPIPTAAPPVAARWIRDARAAWRSLTGGAEHPDATRPTLVALSGGADSAALAIALATLDDARVVLACIQHDLRPAEIVHDDRNAAAGLAAMLGVRIVADHAATAEGNAEHEARRARYRALERIATASGCPWIATAHHADDQTETVLMALCRGGGPDALAGIRPRRAAAGVQVVRPLLSLDPTPARAVCEAYGYSPRVDATNADPARTRARVRRHVLPAIERAFGPVGEHVAAASARLADRLGQLPAGEPLDVGDEPLEA